MPVTERMALLHKVADGITARFDEFLEAECLDTGKPKSLASHVDIPRGAANFKVFADLMKNVPAESFQMDTPDGSGALNYAVRRPRGVVAVIAPWNLPLLLMTWKVGPALACGNTVVVKPSEETPHTAALLGEVMNAAGIPKGVYNVVHGFGPNSAGEYLTRHPGISGITFTGETRTGTAIMKAASESMLPVSFELGGKNAAVVFEAFVQRLKEGAEQLQMGWWEDESVSFGPLISQEHREKVLSYYSRAIADGAIVVTGGGVPDVPEDLVNGAWVQPTIWTGLPDSSAVIREEIFGPCCHIRPFDSEEEVIQLVNDTPYGLAAALWTENLSRAHRVAPQIEVGLCWVNSWFLRDLRTPFGGSKKSGIGREGGVHGLDFYSELSNICIKL